jgi:hypothetical protein
VEICGGRREGVSLAIGEDEVIVFRVDARERREQRPQVNLGPADAARDQIQRVDADAQGSPPAAGKPGNVVPGCSRVGQAVSPARMLRVVRNSRLRPVWQANPLLPGNNG